ncbi:protease inhibitor I42 family protein [Niabella beijingensis]|uniref:protease inhibitor I42 family protein n=1 Tax=Niabella beijingensis TaxID=2872700 RepID=UPI001CBBD408|nr:protease inhibitor I42 family protein [Niabella beijingensis]MBZ4189745.1 protease inhibitor I42 family protein [Niabella beijingensis]
MEKKIRLQAGETFLLQLDSLGGAGYTWIVEQNDERTTRVELSGAGQAPRKKDPIGGSSITTVTITAVSKGTSSIKLVQKRPWEADQPPLKTVRIGVTVA